MILDIFAANGKRRIFYSIQTLVMLAIYVLTIYGLKVLFTYTIDENFLLFIVGAIFAVITLIVITIIAIVLTIVFTSLLLTSF